jgi:hypothetical protein
MFVPATVPQYSQWKLAGEETIILIYILQIIHEFIYFL